MPENALTARHRPEEDLASRWGIYCEATAQWLDVHFASKAEADIAIDIVRKARQRAEKLSGGPS